LLWQDEMKLLPYSYSKMTGSCLQWQDKMKLPPYCYSKMTVSCLQWQDEMKLPPYSYHFPILEDNMRNSSKVVKYIIKFFFSPKNEK
jgi:hypothetical protein